ncbi:hypothetical protein JCM10212_005477 [Sporobolomyces blumeae]
MSNPHAVDAESNRDVDPSVHDPPQLVQDVVPDDVEQDEDEEQDEELYESSSSPSTETDTLTWINWFCSLPGHEYFCDVAEDFIEDDFNLTGLSGLVPFYKEAMEMVLDVEPEEDETSRVPDVSIVESSAELLYGLIHQRYIITRQGLQQMYAKYDSTHFGTCPRVYCAQSKLVPCGRSDLPGVDTVKLFCPSCLDMYVPPSSRFQGVDGAFFGTTFPHLLFQTFPPPSILASPNPDPHTANPPSEREHTTPLTSLSKVYVPRIYGFKVSERARSGPRMQWMRMRPRTEGELDWDENAIRPVVPGAGAGPGGSGEKGDLFDEDLDEEDDDEEEEEEEAGAAGGAGVAGGGVGGGAQEAQGDQMVQEGGRANEQDRRGGQAPGLDLDRIPRRTDREIKPLPALRQQSPLNSPSATTRVSSAPSATNANQDGFSHLTRSSLPSTTTQGVPSETVSLDSTTTTMDASTRASFALAASIQKHLDLANSTSTSATAFKSFDFDFELPRVPGKVVHKAEKKQSFGGGLPLHEQQQRTLIGQAV